MVFVCVPGRGVVVVGVGDDVAVGVVGDCLAGVAGVLGDLGWGHSSFEGEADPAVAEVVGAGLGPGRLARPVGLAQEAIGYGARFRLVGAPGTGGPFELPRPLRQHDCYLGVLSRL